MLEPLLESHAPIDAFICMLGSNDIGPTYKLTPPEIAFGCATLIWTVQKSHAGPGCGVPQILLVAPPPLGKLSEVDRRPRIDGTLGPVLALSAYSFLCAGLFQPRATGRLALDS